jgi:hypothetical protein
MQAQISNGSLVDPRQCIVPQPTHRQPSGPSWLSQTYSPLQRRPGVQP